MASGAILGKCPVCNEHIWEDEWDICDDTILHERCKAEFIGKKLRITENQFFKLSKEQQIKREIEELRNDMKNSFKYYSDELKRLEKLLKE